MKKILVPAMILMSMISFAQTTKKPVAAHPAAAPQPALKTVEDSLSYAVGMYAASFYKEQGIQNVNATLVAKAVTDVVKNGRPLMTDQQANACIIGFVQKMSAAKAEPNKKAGEAFLAENKSKPGVVTLPSGLQYIVLKEGGGPKPTLTDKVRCHYQGTLLDGTIFDSSIQRGQPIEFAVTGVIKGWTEALQLMPVGSKWKLFIPSDLAYGDRGAGNAIQPGATLVFEVELLDIVK